MKKSQFVTVDEVKQMNQETWVDQFNKEYEKPVPIENKKPDDYIHQHLKVFKNRTRFSACCVMEAAVMLVNDIEADEENLMRYQEGCPSIDGPMWAKMRLLGQGMIVEQLLYVSNPVFEKVARLSLTTQKKLLKDGVELVIGDLNNSTFIKVPLNEMNKTDLNQAFSSKCLRTASQQKRYRDELYTKKQQHEQLIIEGDYRINAIGKKVFVVWNNKKPLLKTSQSQINKISKEMECLRLSLQKKIS